MTARIEMIFYNANLNILEISENEHDPWFEIAFMRFFGWEYIGDL